MRANEGYRPLWLSRGVLFVHRLNTVILYPHLILLHTDRHKQPPSELVTYIHH